MRALACAAAEGSPQLLLEGTRATIRLARPSQHNRIDPADIEAIVGHLDEVEARPDVRLLVVTGTGTRTFCSGYTIGAIRTSLDDRFEKMLDRLEACPLPTLCALNGGVYGGGTDLAICCDWRIGVHGSRMFMPAARFGLHYYPGGLRRFVTRLGPVATKKLFLAGRTLQAEEMLRVGYLQELVAPGDLAATVEQYERDLALCEPGVVRSMKRHIDGLADGTWDEARGRRDYEESLRSPELAQRLAALESR